MLFCVLVTWESSWVHMSPNWEWTFHICIYKRADKQLQILKTENKTYGFRTFLYTIRKYLNFSRFFKNIINFEIFIKIPEF